MDDRERYLKLVFPEGMLALGGVIQIRTVLDSPPQPKVAKKYHFAADCDVLSFKQPAAHHLYIAPTTRTGRKARHDLDTVLVNPRPPPG